MHHRGRNSTLSMPHRLSFPIISYIPRSNPDGFDVNFRCIDKSTVKSYSVKPFDGKDSYDKLVGELHHLSK